MRRFINIAESTPDGLVEGPYEGGRILPRLRNGSPPRHLYRIMSVAEYEAGVKMGAFRSNEGRVHADIVPHFEYAEPGDQNVLVAIRYDDADGWTTKWTSLGCVAITSTPIPAEHVTDVARGTRRQLEEAWGL